MYVCNVATQHGETDGFSAADHLAAIEDHIGKGVISYVLSNDNIVDVIPKAELSMPVRVDTPINNGIRLITADVISEENYYHHDSTKLAEAVMRIYEERDQVSAQFSEVEESLVSALE